jgi:protein-S-isoprenylcysteine O-methyltransferase Ste14
MKTPPFNVLVIFCITTHIIRLGYEILKHKKLLKPNKISFIIILINMLLLWFSWYLLCSSDPSMISLPTIINYFGLLLFIGGAILFLTALFTIKSLETYVGDLITTGIYSKIRHPMYLAFIFWLIGLPFYFGGTYSFILAGIFIINVIFWKHLEEIELIERFAGYVDYKKHTLF